MEIAKNFVGSNISTVTLIIGIYQIVHFLILKVKRESSKICDIYMLLNKLPSLLSADWCIAKLALKGDELFWNFFWFFQL